MTALYITLSLFAGFVLGVLATSLAVISSDKKKREENEK